MEKLLAIILAALMLISLAACGNNETPSGSENNPGTSQSGDQGSTENQGGEENNSGTTEPDNTGNDSSENSDAEITTVEDFFAFYGFNAENIKPNHFTSFEDLEMVGSVKIGKQGSKGIVKFNVEKGKTTADDYNAWFEALHAEMTALSEDGKLWYTAGTAKEAMTVEELKAEAWWDSSPYSTCYITTNANGKATRINISYSYDVEAEQYKIIILVHGPG